ncbi:PilZ domain-containing protein [Oceanobacillus bengalensis]|uniref:PilZ domain-containing protein n=1 Tax=Oceanobacillus bengalensis TaxID=1435466 RepID=A0A494Z6G6_9BACI|nr:PilZ domain-containing protein [Oceanobacillus bengalensis]RKQ18160.1 PilZ domain-containing protein [Oceanobacillus bengalensis]
MMRYKRDEAFRYVFGTPLDALFQIVRIDDDPVKTSDGIAKIIDLSPEGAKLHLELNIPEVEHKEIILRVIFQINDKEFNLIGKIMWKRQFGNTYDYGIHFDMEEEVQESLIVQLKIIAKNEVAHTH